MHPGKKGTAGKLIVALCVFIFLAWGVYVMAKVIYHTLKKPPTYQPTSEVIYSPPVHTNTKQPEIVVKEPGRNALLPGATWIPQTFNNCGPATTSMLLQYFGFVVSQEETKSKLRTNADDTNVFTYEMASYIRESYGVSSKLMYGGNVALLKKLIANGFYVVVEDWLHPNEDIGHVTILRGFDDDQGVFIADDSYIGNSITYPYEQFDLTQWKAFNREFLPVYKGENEALLKAIVGDLWDEQTMFSRAAAYARKEIEANDKDMYAWFNLGTSLYGLGKFSDAKSAFETSRSLGWPRRMLWYQIQPVQTYNALGEYEKALELIRIGLAGNDSFTELHLEAARAYKGLGNIQKARAEAQKALQYAPSSKEASDFLSAL